MTRSKAELKRRWKHRMGYNLINGHKVIREKDSFTACNLYSLEHEEFFCVKRNVNDTFEWLHPDEITTPSEAFQAGYEQAVRDQRKLMKEEYANLH